MIIDLFTVLKPKADALIAIAKASAADGKISLEEAWQISQTVALLGYDLLAALQGSGAEKKVTLMALLSGLFDAIVPFLVLPPQAASAYQSIKWTAGWFLPAGWEKQVYLFVISRTIEGFHKYVQGKAAAVAPVAPLAPAPAK